MSWNLWLEIDAGGQEPATIDGYEDNITWNLQPMLSKACMVDGFRSLDGMEANKVSDILKNAMNSMDNFPAYYKKLNPENGWGSYEIALDSLRKLYLACLKYPKATVRIQ